MTTEMTTEMTTDTSAKAAILRAIRRATAAAPEAASIPREYAQRDARPRRVILDEFVERVRDYQAQVERVDAAALPSAIAGACVRYGVRRLVTPADTPAEWVPQRVEALPDAQPLSNAALDGSDAVLTGCAFAIAQTGSIVLDGGRYQGRRALSLLPDRHLCVVFAEQVVGSVPEGIAQVAPAAVRPITVISGPSATSDIELARVEGVHGPRTLHVLLVGTSDSGDS